MPTSTLMWLFEQTRDEHVRFDRLTLRPLMTGQLTITRYREALIRNYGFEAPLDAALAYTPGLSTWGGPRRTGLIVRDLLSLGMRPGQIATLPQCAIAPFASQPEALGWLYVQERSRLVHPLVCARILDQLPMLDDACEYFCRDEVAISTRWAEFAALLDEAEAERHVIRHAARSAFEHAIAWYSDDALQLAR